MKYLHTMVRVTDVDASLKFYCDALGLEVIKRKDYPQGKFTLIFLAAPGDSTAQVELTHNWEPEAYGGGRNFGHLAYAVDDIYAACERLQKHGVTINRPPRDGRMAFVRSPDNISIELLQKDGSLPPREPWVSMPNTGSVVNATDARAHVERLPPGSTRHPSFAARRVRLGNDQRRRDGQGRARGSLGHHDVAAGVRRIGAARGTAAHRRRRAALGDRRHRAHHQSALRHLQRGAAAVFRRSSPGASAPRSASS